MNKYVKKYGRRLDFLPLIDHPNKDQRILQELRTYQNLDGGFGHGLELDIQAPISNIPSTNIAVQYLEHIKDCEDKHTMIEAMVTYYQAMFYENDKRWHMVEQDIDDYPRAIWWNYDARDSFSVLNPTPEILGFLYQHQEYVSTIDLDQEIERMVKRILDLLPKSKSFHDILSISYFYERVPYIRNEIHPLVELKVKEFLSQTEEDYHLRAHQVYLISPSMVKREQLIEDLEALDKELTKHGYIFCRWQWFQYPDTFEEIRPLWNAYLTRQAIEAIEKFEEER